jgi:hypothetical protein
MSLLRIIAQISTKRVSMSTFTNRNSRIEARLKHIKPKAEEHAKSDAYAEEDTKIDNPFHIVLINE